MALAEDRSIPVRPQIWRGAQSVGAKLRSDSAVAPAAVLFAWLAALAFVFPYDPDEAVYASIAEGILDGRWPYRDLFDHKPPLIYAWYVPATAVGGIELARLTAAALVAASIFPFRLFARRHLPEGKAGVAAWLYALVLASPMTFAGANTEAFSLLPIMLSLVVASPVAAGALVGVAIMTKPVALSFAPLLFMRWGTAAWRSILALAGACLAVMLPFAPIWRDALDANVGFNLDYGGYVEVQDRLRNALLIHPSALLPLAGVWIAGLLGVLLRPHRIVIALAICGLVSAKASGYEFQHYYVLVAPGLALLAASGLERMRSRPAGRAALAFTGAAFVLLAVLTVAVAHRMRRDDDAMAAAIDGMPGEVFVLGHHTNVHAYTGREPERRFFFAAPLAVREEWGQRTRRDLIACPPSVLVVPEHAIFNLAWVTDVEALYVTRREFEHAVVLTTPRTACDRASD